MTTDDPHDGSGEAVLLPCPHCHRPSTRIKSLRTGVLAFLGIFAYWRTWTETGCAECVRGTLLKWSAINLVTANVMWPIAILPWMTVQLLRTGLDGHSPDVLANLGLPAPPPRPLWTQFREAWPIGFRVLGLVQCLLGTGLVAAVAFAVGDSWYGSHGVEAVFAAVVAGAAGAGAAYLAYSALCKLLGMSPSLANRLGVACLAGIALGASSPLLAQTVWAQREKSLHAAALGGDRFACEKYVDDVPVELWRPEPLAGLVDPCLAHIREWGQGWGYWKLQTLQFGIETYHADDPAFAPVRRRIDDALKKKAPASGPGEAGPADAGPAKH
jgi:hypothetical protein